MDPNKVSRNVFNVFRMICFRKPIIPSRKINQSLCKFNPHVQYIFYSGLLFGWVSKKDDHVNITNKKDIPISLLVEADNLFENGHYQDCYDLLSKCELGNNVEIQWRICRAMYNLSKDPKFDESLKKDLILKAFDIISTQLQSHSDNFAVHKWYALLLDAKSSHDGIKERIRQLETIRKHMDLAVTLNPDDATTLHMLGEWCYQVAELPWHQRKIAEVFFASPPRSTYDDALEYYLRAEEVQPRFYSLNLLRLGCCYLKLDKVDQAKYYLKLAASYPAKSNDDHQANKEAAELLRKLKL